MDIIIGRERRRWSEEERRALVAEAAQPGESVIAVAKRRGVNASMLFTWRKRMRLEQAPAFAPLMIAPPAGGSSSPPGEAPAAIEITFSCGARLRVSGGADVVLVTAVVKALGRA